jgi:hypothetical protein
MADCDGQFLGFIAAPVANEGPLANEGAHAGAKGPHQRSEYQDSAAEPGTPPKKGARAKQTVTPATRERGGRKAQRPQPGSSEPLPRRYVQPFPRVVGATAERGPLPRSHLTCRRL